MTTSTQPGTTREIPPGLLLGKGRHRSIEEGACALELISWLVRESWSDQPKCVHPVLGALVRVINDRITDREARTAFLLPRAKLLIDTTKSLPDRLAHWAVMNRLLRELLPPWVEASPVFAETSKLLFKWRAYGRAHGYMEQNAPLQTAWDVIDDIRATAEREATAENLPDHGTGCDYQRPCRSPVGDLLLELRDTLPLSLRDPDPDEPSRAFYLGVRSILDHCKTRLPRPAIGRLRRHDLDCLLDLLDLLLVAAVRIVPRERVEFRSPWDDYCITETIFPVGLPDAVCRRRVSTITHAMICKSDRMDTAAYLNHIENSYLVRSPAFLQPHPPMLVDAKTLADIQAWGEPEKA